MPKIISVDEYLSKRKDFVKSGNTIMKAARSPASWNSDARSATFVMSTEDPDLDDDIVFQAGIDFTNFMKNPVCLGFHNSRTWPVGSWSNIKTIMGNPNKTEGDCSFLPVGADPDSDRMANHVAAGTIRACSVGFIPTKIQQRENDDPDGGWPGFNIMECQLVECSLVPIPANPSALIKSADGDFKAARELIEEVLDTWAKHPATGLLIPRSEYEAALKTINGDRTSFTVKIDTEEVQKSIAKAAGDAVEAVKTENLSILERIKNLFKPAAPMPEPEPKIAEQIAKTAASARSKALVERLQAAGRI